jgi:protoporphyrinogen oxidase
MTATVMWVLVGVVIGGGVIGLLALYFLAQIKPFGR